MFFFFELFRELKEEIGSNVVQFRSNLLANENQFKMSVYLLK